jgi:putative polyhydroxyalkanoate system protein
LGRIDVRRPHKLGKEAARQAAAQVAERMQREFAIEYRWDGDHLRFSRPGVSGYVLVHDRAVEVSVELGFLLLPMRAQIEGQIREFLEHHFA